MNHIDILMVEHVCDAWTLRHRKQCMHNFTRKLASDWICIEIEFCNLQFVTLSLPPPVCSPIRCQFLLIIAQFDTNSIYANSIFSTNFFFSLFAVSSISFAATIIEHRNDRACYSWAWYESYIFHAIYYAKECATFFFLSLRSRTFASPF